MVDFSSLSNEEVLKGVTDESRCERRSMAYVVRYLAEIETRRLYLEFGFSSLFDFTTNRLGYSSSAAVRRIKAARLSLIDSSISEKLESGELNFATIDVLSNFARDPQFKVLIKKLCGRSREEAEVIVAHLRPVPHAAVRDSVKPVVILPKLQDAGPLLPFKSDENTTYLRPNAQTELRQCEEFGTKPEERFYISLTMDRAEKELLDRARGLMFAGNVNDISFGRVIGKALKFYLAHHCPRERQRRREERAAKHAKVTEMGDRTADAPSTRTSSHDPECSARDVSVILRDRILARDGYQCAFVGTDGRRCDCRVDLEIDHIIPAGQGGKTEDGNLRVLCRPHNLARAYACYGEEFVRKRIAAREGGRARLGARPNSEG